MGWDCLTWDKSIQRMGLLTVGWDWSLTWITVILSWGNWIELFIVGWKCSKDGIVRSWIRFSAVGLDYPKDGIVLRGMGFGRKTGVSRFQLSSAVDTLRLFHLKNWGNTKISKLYSFPSKHLKGQLGAPVSDSHIFWSKGGQLGPFVCDSHVFESKGGHLGPYASDGTYFWSKEVSGDPASVRSWGYGHGRSH